MLLWGPLRETAVQVLNQLRFIEASNPYFHLYDANIDGNHDYEDREAFDYDHLCAVGAGKLTRRLDTLIDSILSKKAAALQHRKPL